MAIYHRQTLATVKASTDFAPAFFKALAHSFRVEPVVNTSSIRTMRFPLMFSGWATSKAFRTFFSRCLPLQ